jgi:excisionase family DNA binding protein
MATKPSLPPDNPAEDIVTAEELAAYLKVDPHTVLNWAKAGIIPESFRVGRTVRFSLEAVKASLDVNNAGEGRYVELASAALKLMLGDEYARTPALDPDTITVVELQEIQRQVDLQSPQLMGLETPQERAYFAEAVLDAARYAAKLGKWPPKNKSDSADTCDA